ncbi:SAF domain-containing protein [Brevibacterium daeguense]|nr:SAF domain-containing protein [Brevibacterium daeguense]
MAVKSPESEAVPKTHKLPAAGRDRRPLMMALAIVLILVGAIASALIAFSAGSRSDVLVAVRDIEPGQTISEADFTTARVGTDAAGIIPADSLENFVGSHAVSLIPQGTVVNQNMFVSGSAIPSNGEVVGLVLTPTQRPSEPLASGDVVRLYQGAGVEAGGGTGQVLVESARVVSVIDAGGNLSVSVLIGSDQAATLVPSAAAGQVAATKLAQGTRPGVDFLSQ